MARIEMSHEELKAKLFHISSLQQKEREKIAQAIIHLSNIDDWYPDALRRELRKLQSAGLISEVDRHAVEKVFFSDHTW